MSDQELDYNVGEDESPMSVAVTETEGQDTSASVVSESNANELDDYSSNVKKRIDKMTARLRETERREQAAIQYAQGMQARMQQLEHRVVRTDEERLHEASGRVETQVVALKQIIGKAREEGDIQTEIEANTRLTSLIHEQRQIAEANAQRQVYQEQLAYQQHQAAQQPIQQARPVVDEKAANWVDKNSWYGRDTVLTSAAWGIHRQLIEVEGFDGRSDEYYDELDRRLRSSFPGRFNRDRTTRTVQTVAPATRSSGVNNARRIVRLTASQVAIAKKLGVPIEEYAKYVKD
jgi:hypothetical protein